MTETIRSMEDQLGAEIDQLIEAGNFNGYAFEKDDIIQIRASHVPYGDCRGLILSAGPKKIKVQLTDRLFNVVEVEFNKQDVIPFNRLSSPKTEQQRQLIATLDKARNELYDKIIKVHEDRLAHPYKPRPESLIQDAIADTESYEKQTEEIIRQARKSYGHLYGVTPKPKPQTRSGSGGRGQEW